ncbi:hypothetical protein HRbin16_02068 [bacterium HR16]|nr:hypothetical protein HRbin16_02068 [bacterium HR16]
MGDDYSAVGRAQTLKLSADECSSTFRLHHAALHQQAGVLGVLLLKVSFAAVGDTEESHRISSLPHESKGSTSTTLYIVGMCTDSENVSHPVLLCCHVASSIRVNRVAYLPRWRIGIRRLQELLRRDAKKHTIRVFGR